MHRITKEAIADDPNAGFFCTCCDRKLNPKTMTWLEMDMVSGRYHAVGKLPEDAVSQGCFPFGVACAKAVRS